MINIPKILHLNYKIFVKGKISKTERELIQKLASLTLKQEKIQNNNIILDFIICNKHEMLKYSKQYLDKDHATDIISIKNEDNNEIIKAEKTILGTIILCPQVIKESQNQNKLFNFCHLVIHGTLHLLGYNHNKAEDALKMQNKETHILSKLSIKSPYY